MVRNKGKPQLTPGHVTTNTSRRSQSCVTGSRISRKTRWSSGCSRRGRRVERSHS
jgi:hypothetical protein